MDPNRVGIMGFSAGGETAAMVATAPSDLPPAGSDAIDKLSAKPNFVALVYAGPLGIRDAKVTREYPPTFILVGDNDGAGSWLVNHYLALKKAGVSSELHVYAKTPHGFGVRAIKEPPAGGLVAGAVRGVPGGGGDVEEDVTAGRGAAAPSLTLRAPPPPPARAPGLHPGAATEDPSC